MFKRKKKKINGKAVSVIDGTKASYTQFGVGVVKGNPKRPKYETVHLPDVGESRK